MVGHCVADSAITTADGQKTVCLQGLFGTVADVAAIAERTIRRPSCASNEQIARRSPMQDFFPATPPRRPLCRLSCRIGVHPPTPGTASILGHSERGWCFVQTGAVGDDPRPTALGKDIVVDHSQCGGEQRRRGLDIHQTGRARRHRQRPGPDSATASCSIPPNRWTDRPRCRRLRWSPLQSCTTWLPALSMARSLVEVGSGPGGGPGPRWGFPLDRAGPGPDGAACCMLPPSAVRTCAPS